MNQNYLLWIVVIIIIIIIIIWIVNSNDNGNMISSRKNTSRGWRSNSSSSSSSSDSSTSSTSSTNGECPCPTDHNDLTSIGTNTHASIDTHLADTTTHFTKYNMIAFSSITQATPLAVLATTYILPESTTTGDWDSVAKKWTCPVAGRYRFTVKTIATKSPISSTTSFNVLMVPGAGEFVSGVEAVAFVGAVTGESMSFSNAKNGVFLAGGTVELRIGQSGGGSSGMSGLEFHVELI